MRYAYRSAVVVLPPVLTLALVACGKSPTAPDKVVLEAGGCPAGYLCTDTPREGTLQGAEPTPPPRTGKKTPRPTATATTTPTGATPTGTATATATAIATATATATP
jgi:hypothetical protein